MNSVYQPCGSSAGGAQTRIDYRSWCMSASPGASGCCMFFDTSYPDSSGSSATRRFSRRVKLRSLLSSSPHMGKSRCWSTSHSSSNAMPDSPSASSTGCNQRCIRTQRARAASTSAISADVRTIGS